MTIYLKRQVLFEGKASIQFKSGAYTIVREHFEPNRNAAIGREMKVRKPVIKMAEF